jgi:quinoprotein glucose dehydrogenase
MTRWLSWMITALWLGGLDDAWGQHAAPTPDATSFQLPEVPPGRAEAEKELRRLSLPPGWTARVWAAEPDVVHPVSFEVTGNGRVFVAESLRAWRGVPDIRNLLPWLDADLAARTVDDRLALMRRLWGDVGLELYSLQSERVRLLTDTNGDGQADRSQVFATGFNSPLDGVASSVLSRGNEVWFANIPDIWWLSDDTGDGVADRRRSLSHGHGVRISMLGHDLHGLTWGPDGRIYVSVGDRASRILHEGRWIGDAECGAVFRFEPDGSGLEMFASGLRNPQELVFDDWGNLFSGDNSANTGDESRWVHIVSGGDSGWRIGWQWADNPAGINDGQWRGGASGPGATAPWITEGLWRPAHPGQPAYLMPPVANFSAGPCGVARYPGTGLDDSWDGQFLLTDFRGSSNDSLLWRFRVIPEGAGFRVADRTEWIRGVNATDVSFGPDGSVWLLDWTDGWEPAHRGRIHILQPPPNSPRNRSAETAQLLRTGMGSLPNDRCVALLDDPDQRVRQEAQFALASRGRDAVEPLRSALASTEPVARRRHALWALGQIARQAQRHGGLDPALALTPLLPLLADPHPGIRRTAASVLGDLRFPPAQSALIKATTDSDPTVRREAALALGLVGGPEAVESLVTLARQSGADPVLRHAVVMGLLGSTDTEGVLRVGQDPSPTVRLVAVVALRRMERTELSRFLADPDAAVRAEAARAIHDLPISSALPDLARITNSRLTEPAFSRRVVNAGLRVGTPETARGLVTLATNSSLPEPLRADALTALTAWPANAGRDRVTGLWRPVALPRRAVDAADSLAPVLTTLLQDPSHSVVAETASAAAALKLNAAGPTLNTLARETRRPARVRIAALRALAELQDPQLPATVDALFATPDPEVRGLALRLAARLSGPAALPLLARVLENGTASDQQAAFAGLTRLTDPLATALLSTWMDRLLAGTVAPAIQLDLLEAAEASADPNLQQRVTRYRETLGTDPVAPYLTSLEGGSAEAGQALFQSAEVQCIRCHKLWDRGGEVGPDLSRIGSQLDRRALLESIVAPDLRLAPGYETVLVTLDDEEVHSGIAIGEDADQLRLRLADGTRLDLPKNRIRSRERGMSAMPSGLAEILGRRRLRDLVEYLATLK